MKYAVGVAGHVEEIVKAAIRGQAEPDATSEWLADLSPIMEGSQARGRGVDPSAGRGRSNYIG